MQTRRLPISVWPIAATTPTVNGIVMPRKHLVQAHPQMSRFALDIFNHKVEYLLMSKLDLAFSALADPTRRRIVARLARGHARVTDLAEPFAMSLNAVSKHLKVLERSGLVKRERLGREHYLRLHAAPLREVARWASQYERFWNQRLDALEEFLSTKPE
jgi:DNA-binding transcriptional ArsR family regulator